VLKEQPNGPFALLVHCEDALGTYVTILFQDPMTNPVQNAWKIEERTWYEKKWNSDVTSYMWTNDGKHLILATSGIYGVASVHKLSPFEKKSEVIYAPSASAHGVSIVLKKFDKKSRKLTIEEADDGASKSVSIQL
jgi:hypothetical protein